MVPRVEEAPSTRDLILEVAERHFAERGFAGGSMREIAAEAGLKNQASLYHHFENKRALYEAALARGVEPIVRLIAESQTAAAPDPVLDRVIDYLADRPHLPRLIQRAGVDDARYVQSIVTRLLRPLWARGLEVLAATGGPWQPADLPCLAAGLYHLIFGYFANAPLLEVILEEDPRSPRALARQRRFLKTAMARLLGVGPARRYPRAVRKPKDA